MFKIILSIKQLYHSTSVEQDEARQLAKEIDELRQET